MEFALSTRAVMTVDDAYVSVFVCAYIYTFMASVAHFFTINDEKRVGAI